MTPTQSGSVAAQDASNLRERRAPPAVMTIFGASGDLTKRLIVPALYNLVRANKLSDDFSVIGVDHTDRPPQEWIQSLSEMLEQFTGCAVDKTAWSWLTQRMQYLCGDFADDATFTKLKTLLAKHKQAPNGLFYLAVADRFFAPVIEQLGKAGLTEQSNHAWRRVIIEKPFGHDLASAKALNARVLKVLSEDQVYRIDHFLGKETVQNILVARFANGIFEPLWSRDHIDHVQITVAETVGVERRARFYEATGALCDMVPNHVFQLLSLTAMEPPNAFDADAVRTEKHKVLEAITPLDGAEVRRNTVRGQYGAGVTEGHPAVAYRQEPGVAHDSMTETYVAMRLGIDNWRWAGVPFYLRTGKHLARRT